MKIDTTKIDDGIANRYVIQVPEFKSIGEVDLSDLKLEFTLRKRKKRAKLFNFFWDWYKSKSD